MTKKRFRIQTSCPQCGCSAVANLSKEEIQERFGDVPNVELECSECMLIYETEMQNACPEWDEECRMQNEKK